MRGRPVSEELPKSLPKLKELLEAREKQLKSMAEVLGEFNIRITDLAEKNAYYKKSNVELAQSIKSKSDQLLKEMKENMEMTHRITDLEKKISMLKKKLGMNDEESPVKGSKPQISKAKDSPKEENKVIPINFKISDNKDAQNPQESEEQALERKHVNLSVS